MKTSKNWIYFIISVLFVFVLIGCKTDRKNLRVELNDKWEYSLSEEGIDDYRYLAIENLRDLTPYITGDKGYIWLKTSFYIPENLSKNDLSVYLGRITLADETYLNDVLIGSEGNFPPYEWSAWNKVRLYHMPKNLLKYNEVNTFKIKIWINGEGSIVSTPFVGKTEDAEVVAAIQDFWNSKINLLCAFVMLVIAAYNLFLYFRRRESFEYLLFSIINIVSALYLSVFYINQIPGLPYEGMSFLIFQKIFSSALPFVLIYLVGSFAVSFLKTREKRFVKILRIVLMIIPLIFIIISPNYSILRRIRTITQLFLVPPVLYILYVVLQAAFRRKKNVGPLLVGFSPLVVAICVDLFIHNVLKLYNVPYISMYGWMLVILALLFIFAHQFSQARKESEDLNQHLEQKVKERTRELSEANEQLAYEQEKADKDMKLAVYVQQSFYPRKAPVVEGYDIAYCFKPMSGVSGDLFDFYTSGKNLDGVALFDVSGHGIASGLVTMLAKTIISREFERGKNKTLSEVMYNVNDSIIDDKGDVENYLTGILLRFSDDCVTYVNAAHPSLLCRTANGVVREACVNGQDASGSLVGMKDLPVEYNGVRFKMNKGDSILLFTDCLYESKDSDEGESYGIERISRTFEKATGNTAQEKLNSVLQQFNDYTAKKPLTDDLTVILIQKR